MRQVIILALALGIPFYVGTPASLAGGEGSAGTRGGGNFCELEFRGFIPSVVEWLRTNAKKLNHGVDSDKFSETALRLKPQCANRELSLGAVNKSAITDRATMITEINQSHWSHAPDWAKRALVLHEGLVAMRVESTDDYSVSSQMWAGVARFGDKTKVSCRLRLWITHDDDDYYGEEPIDGSEKTVVMKEGDYNNTIEFKDGDLLYHVSGQLQAGEILLRVWFQKPKAERVLVHGMVLSNRELVVDLGINDVKVGTLKENQATQLVCAIVGK